MLDPEMEDRIVSNWEKRREKLYPKVKNRIIARLSGHK